MLHLLLLASIAAQVLRLTPEIRKTIVAKDTREGCHIATLKWLLIRHRETYDDVNINRSQREKLFSEIANYVFSTRVADNRHNNPGTDFKFICGLRQGAEWTQPGFPAGVVFGMNCVSRLPVPMVHPGNYYGSCIAGTVDVMDEDGDMDDISRVLSSISIHASLSEASSS